MEWLKELLKDVPEGEKIVESIQKELPKYFKPAEVFNTVNNELKATKDQLAGMNTTLEDLTKKSQTAEEYKTQLDKLSLDHAEFVKNADKRIAEVQKSHVLQNSLLEAGADKSAVDLLAGTIDLNTIELADGKIKDFENLLKPIKESRPTLFKVETIDGTPPNKPAGGEPAANTASLREIMGLPPIV